MFNIIKRLNSGLPNSHKALNVAIAMGILSGGVASPALAEDGEIVLKANTTIAADPIFGIVDLGGTALVGVEPDEIDLKVDGTAAGSAATGGTTSAGLSLGSTIVELDGILLEGLAPTDVDLGRAGVAYLTVEAPKGIRLDNIEVTGTYGPDATGMETYVSLPGQLHLEPIEGQLRAEQGATGIGGLGLSIAFLAMDIDHSGGAGFRVTNVTLKRGVIEAGSPLVTDLPSLVQAGSSIQEDMGCTDDNGECLCGGVDSCNTLLAGCFTPGIDGSWDCVQYNDQGQCVLGMCEL